MRTSAFGSRVLLALVACLLFHAFPAVAQEEGEGYFRTQGTEIVDPEGNPVILRGLGLGGWLVPEGYMLRAPSPVDSPTRIREAIVDLIGSVNAEEFYDRYEANYVNEADIAQIAAWGFDHVRLPFHYNQLFDPETETFIEEGFERFDTFIEWCRTHGLGVVLDMHAAPGAQSEFNIADSDGEARLWTEPVPYQDWTVAIWKEIAERYVDERLIIGYDLINEPVTPEGIPTSDLRDLYVRITNAVRAVDPHHILFIEGNFFATTFGDLEEPRDENMVYAFHKYWNPPNVGTIQYLLDLRENAQRPLWLGETGENSNTWYYEVSRLAESHGIGWNWWTHKKIDTVTSPLSAPFAPGYEAVLAYWRGEGPQPQPLAARAGLFAMADGLALENCELRPGVLASLLDPEYDTLRLPFKAHGIPGVIDVIDYDLGNEGTTYRDSQSLNASGSPGNANNGDVYRNDGVDIERSTDPEGAPFNVGWTETLEMMSYTVTIEQAGRYAVAIRVASDVGGGQLSLALDNDSITGFLNVDDTGGWQNWVTLQAEVVLPAGEHILEVRTRQPGYNINRMTFSFLGPVNAEEQATPEAAALLGIFPNPTRGPATLTFNTPGDTEVFAEVFDLVGRSVWRRPAHPVSAGTHTVEVPGAFAPGVYVVRLRLGDGATAKTFERRLTVLR